MLTGLIVETYFTLYTHVELPCFTPETNIMLCANYNSLKINVTFFVHAFEGIISLIPGFCGCLEITWKSNCHLFMRYCIHLGGELLVNGIISGCFASLFSPNHADKVFIWGL